MPVCCVSAREAAGEDTLNGKMSSLTESLQFVTVPFDHLLYCGLIACVFDTHNKHH